MIISAIDTKAIGKYIWNKIYLWMNKNNVTQTAVAEKLWINPNAVWVYLTWTTTTKNLEQYWRIAEKAWISRQEFDTIVDEAKKSVLGVSPASFEDIQIATLVKESWLNKEDLEKAISIYKTLNK